MKHFYYATCPEVDLLNDICVLRFKHEFGHYTEPERERNTRNFFKITLINHGEAILFCNENEHKLSSGNIFLSHPDDLTSYRINTELLDIYDLIFKKNVLEDVCTSSGKQLKNFFSDQKQIREDNKPRVLNAGKALPKIIRLMFQESHYDGIYHSQSLLLYLQLVMIHLERILAVAGQGSVSEEMVAIVDKAINENFASSFDFQKLAAKVGVSREHLGRVFRKARGLSISKALKRKRLNNAAKLLENTKYSISEAASNSGIQDLAYFYRAFKEEFKMSPSDFIKTTGIK